MAGFDNRYGTEYGGLAAQMGGVERGRQGALTRLTRDRLERAAYQRQMELLDLEELKAQAQSKGRDPDAEMALARLFADQSQHEDKMGLDTQRLGLDTQRFGFDVFNSDRNYGLERDKFGLDVFEKDRRFGLDSANIGSQMSERQANEMLLRQKFQGVEDIGQVTQDPVIQALARAEQLDKIENIKRNQWADALLSGQMTLEQSALANTGFGNFGGIPDARRSGGVLSAKESGDRINAVIQRITGIDPENANTVPFTGNPDDRAAVLLDRVNSLTPERRALLDDASANAGSAQEELAAFEEILGLKDLEWATDVNNPVSMFFRDRFGQGEALQPRTFPSEEELAVLEESGNDPDLRAELKARYPKWDGSKERPSRWAMPSSVDLMAGPMGASTIYFARQMFGE